MRRILLVGLVLAATSILPGRALAAPRWLEPALPFGDVPARQDEAGAVMAQDGRIVFARVAPDGALEVRERPAGGPVGATVTIAPVADDDAAPASHLRVLIGADGSAAVLFDAGDERYVSLRAPAGAWGDPLPVGSVGAESGQEGVAPDGELWRVGPAPGSADRLAVYRQRAGELPRATLLSAPALGARDVTPVLTLPGAGGAHVVYVEEGTTGDQGLCLGKTVVLAADVPATGDVTHPATLDIFRASGTGSATGCAFDDGELVAGSPLLVTNPIGADTAVYPVRSFPALTVTPQARHRDAGGHWPNLAEPAEVAGDGIPEQIVGGRGLPLLAMRSTTAESVAMRRPDGTWSAPAPLVGPDGARALQAARTGAGTTVFAWAERGAAGRIVGRVVDTEGVPGDLVAPAPASPGAMVLGVGGDAEGNGVALYSRPQGDDFVLAASGYDAAPPRLTSLSAPSDGAATDPLDFSAAGLDVWSGPVTDVTWDFGDGVTANGVAVRHAYADPGDRIVQATLRDPAGNATIEFAVLSISAPPPPTENPAPTPAPTPTVVPLPPPPARDTRAPALSLAGGSRSGHRPTLVATTDEKGRLAVTLTSRRRRAHHVNTLLSAGTHRVALPKLATGNWTASATVTDAAGNRSRPRSLRFRVSTSPPSHRDGGTGRPGEFGGPFPPDR